MISAFRFLYTAEVELDLESVFFIHYAADKYAIEELADECKYFLERNLHADNVCTIIEYGSRYHMDALVNKCMKLVKKDTEKVFASDDFMSLSQKGLECIIEAECSVDPECLYRACKRWASAKVEQRREKITPEKLREILGDTIKKIHFNEMTYSSFVDTVVVDNILTGNEVQMYLLSIRETQRNKVDCLQTEILNNG